MAGYSGVRPVNLFADFLAGREAAHSDRAMRNRNALADIDIERERSVNALMQNPDATPEQYARVGRSDIGNAITNTRQFEQNSKVQAVQQLGSVAQKALSLPAQARKQFLRQAAQMYGGAFQALGADMSQLPQMLAMPDNELEQRLQQVAAFGPALKEAEGFTLSEGQQRFDASGRLLASGTPKRTEAPEQWATMTPAEMKAAGLPDGTVAQRSLTTGKIDITNKREGLSAADQKVVREAKVRMPRLNAALRRVDRVGTAVEALKNNRVMDGGPLDAKALQYTKEGRELMAAVATLMPELQALTRVPGIGLQSDLEARLASLALPSLEMEPEINARTQAELVAFVQDLKAAYDSLLASGNPEQAAAIGGGWTIEEVP